jgi:hypothetical protein
MQIKGLGFGVLVAAAALIGCGSSSPAGGTGSGGNTGSGGKGSGGTGSGGTNGAGAFTTSVPSGTKLTGLTTGQATQLCADFNTYAQKTLAPALCTTLGILSAEFSGATSDADLQAACTAGYNSCLTSDGGTTSGCTASTVMTEPAACTATVGDLTTCANAMGDANNQIPSCSTLTAASLAALNAADAGSTSSPPSCAMFVTGGACTGVSMSFGN